ncbi:MAG: peptidoglycan DD-metalloendopeptidase family protein [Limnospira sp.]
MQPISGDATGTEMENSASGRSDWQPSILRNLTESNNAAPMSGLNETPSSVAAGDGETEIEVDEPTNLGAVVVPEPSLSKSEDKSFSFESDAVAIDDRTEQLGDRTPQTLPDATRQIPGPLVIDADLNPSISVVYQVDSGDTLDRIARIYGVAVADILTANHLSDPNFIKVNQELKIPKLLSDDLDRQKHGTRADALKWEGFRLDGDKMVSRLPEVGGSEGDLGGASVRSRLSQTVIPSVIPSEIQGNLTKPVGLKLNLADGSFDTGSDRLPKLGKDFTPISPDSAKDPEVGESKDLSSRESDSTPRKLASLNNRPTTKLYTDRLRSEVERLRAEYRAEQFDRTYSYQAVSLSQDSENAIEEPTQIVAAPSPDLPLHRINPEFNPAAYDPQKDPENGTATAPSPQEVARRPEGDKDREAVVATAPLGADAYDPLQNPAIGRIVSPDLPPLPGPDVYLPGGSMRFNGYIWPSEGILTSGYGWRWGRMHRGIDIAGPIGTPIVAAAPGVVTYAGWNSGGYGNLVELEHPDGSLTLYAHNHRILVNKGQKVTQGQQIAEMGSTGRSTGPHLHFEIHPSGQGAVNPMALLPEE